jgi:hypothetical protein
VNVTGVPLAARTSVWPTTSLFGVASGSSSLYSSGEESPSFA